MAETVNNAPAQSQAQPQTTSVVISKAAADAQSYMKQMTEKGGLVVPENYSVINAITGATFKLQEINNGKSGGYKTLEDGICTQVSIATALKSMLTKGEDIAQGHGYFIIRGKQLCYDESYLGCLHRVYRDTNVTKVNAQIIYADDDFSFTSDNGNYRILRHESKLANIDLTKIVGAYAVVMSGDKVKHVEIMTMDMIRKAWAMSQNSNGKIFTDYPDQMAKRTVIKRACKIILAAETGLNMVEDEFSTYEDVTDQGMEVREMAQQEPLVEVEVAEAAPIVEEKPSNNESNAVAEVAVTTEQPAPNNARRERRNLLN